MRATNSKINTFTIINNKNNNIQQNTTCNNIRTIYNKIINLTI